MCTMNKMTEEELLSIIERYEYDLDEGHGSLRAIKRYSDHINPERTPLFGRKDDRYWQLKRIAAWIMETEND